MTPRQRILTRQSEIRERLNALLGIEERSAEEQTEFEALVTEGQKLEPELRAAILAEAPTDTTVTGADGLDAEARERLELRGRAHFGAFVLAALQGREVAGADLEYRQSLDLHTGIPIDLFEADRPAPAAETRAVTPAPSTGTGVVVAPIQPYVFSPSIAPRLGIDMPSVGSGGYSEMTVSTALPAGPRAKGVAADGTAGALTAVTANPRRISARLSLAIEDVAAVGQAGFESALRQNTSMSLSDAYDNQCINGDGVAPNVNGLIAQLTDPNNPTSVATFDDFVASFADSIDGLWASMVSEVAIVANVDAYKLSAKTFRDASGADLGSVTFASYAEKLTGGWWTNERMPATPSTGTDATIGRGIVYRKGRMGMRTASHPVWGTLSIDDIYTDSASGQRHFSVHMLVGDKVMLVQPAAYDLVEYKVS